MRFSFEEIRIKKERLLEKGCMILPDTGLYVIQGANGCGKSLLINYLFEKKVEESIPSILIEQSTQCILRKESALGNISFTTNNSRVTESKLELTELGCEYLLEHDTDKMSGGEIRMMCLLRGLFSRAKVYFIDEPTNDLSYRNVEFFASLLKERSRESLIIVVSHDDRISKLADGIIKFQNCKLYGNCSETKVTHGEVEKCPDDAPPTGEVIGWRDPSFCKKQFSDKLIIYIIASVYIVSMFLIVHQVVNSTYEEIPHIRDTQVDLFIPVSEYGRKINDESLPTASILLLADKIGPLEYMSRHKELQNDNTVVNFTLDIPDIDECDKYDLEYYDVSEHQNLFTIDKYLERTGEDDIDTSLSFDKPYEQSNELAYKNIDLELFRKCEKEIAKKNTQMGCEVVFCTLIFREKPDVKKLFLEGEMSHLLYGNFYIRCNDIIDIVNYGNLLAIELHAVVAVLCIILILTLMQMLFLFVYIRSEKSTIRSFKNMAYDKMTVAESIFNGINGRLLFIVEVLISIGLGFTVVISKRGMAEQRLITCALMGVMLFVGGIIIMWGTSKFIIKKLVRYYVKWNAR